MVPCQYWDQILACLCIHPPVNSEVRKIDIMLAIESISVFWLLYLDFGFNGNSFVGHDSILDRSLNSNLDIPWAYCVHLWFKSFRLPNAYHESFLLDIFWLKSLLFHLFFLCYNSPLIQYMQYMWITLSIWIDWYDYELFGFCFRLNDIIC